MKSKMSCPGIMFSMSVPCQGPTPIHYSVEPFSKDVLDHGRNIESDHQFWAKVIGLFYIMVNRKTEPHRRLPYSDRLGNHELEREGPLRLFPIVNEAWICSHGPTPTQEESHERLYR